MLPYEIEGNIDARPLGQLQLRMETSWSSVDIRMSVRYATQAISVMKRRLSASRIERPLHEPAVKVLSAMEFPLQWTPAPPCENRFACGEKVWETVLVRWVLLKVEV